MKKTFMIAVSALAVMAATPALAESTVQSRNTSTTQTTSSQQAVTGQPSSFNAVVIGDSTDAGQITIDSRTAASGMLGQPVYNSAGERLATIDDIILDANGEARMVVLSEGGFMGIGDKLAAFDYALVSNRQQDGDVIMPLSEETLKQVRAFSYDRKDQSDTVRVMPDGSYRVSKLLDADLVNPAKEDIADVENIVFRNGVASYLVVEFDDTLGMGGKQAVLSFKDLTVLKDGDDLDFQMSANQAARFEDYKKRATN